MLVIFIYLFWMSSYDYHWSWIAFG